MGKGSRLAIQTIVEHVFSVLAHSTEPIDNYGHVLIGGIQRANQAVHHAAVFVVVVWAPTITAVLVVGNQPTLPMWVMIVPTSIVTVVCHQIAKDDSKIPCCGTH